MKLSIRSLAAAAILFTGMPASAEDSPGWLARATNEVAATYREGTPEYYTPLHTYHMRWAYTRERIDRYQEATFGFGYGHGRFDDHGNWHGLYAMGFQDSHFKPQWLAGYGWKTYWNLGENARLGFGYTAGVTARSDIGHYAPVPVLLPIGSFDYRSVSLESAYVPGGKGFGNILFFWLKWRPGQHSAATKVAS